MGSVASEIKVASGGVSSAHTGMGGTPSTGSRWVIMALAVLAGLVASGGLVAVITAGFALSFDAIGAVGRASGVRAEVAWLLPAAVDGAMSVGTVTAVVVRRLRRSTAYPWTVVLVNAGISVACNALHAQSRESLPLPVNLAMSVHLLVTLIDALADHSGLKPNAPAPGPHDRRALEEATGCAENPGGGAAVPSAPAPRPARAQGALATGGEGNPVQMRQLQCAAWVWARQNRRPDGSLVSGGELAKEFGRSPRWGRLVKQLGAAGQL